MSKAPEHIINNHTIQVFDPFEPIGQQHKARTIDSVFRRQGTDSSAHLIGKADIVISSTLRNEVGTSSIESAELVGHDRLESVF